MNWIISTCLDIFCGLWSEHPTVAGFFGGETVVLLLVFIPSNIRMSKTLGGSSSTRHSTSVRHSGHLNSLCVATISSRHFLQNVCWQDRTLLDVSKRSRHTEHSSKSFNSFSSIIDVEWLIKKNWLNQRVTYTIWKKIDKANFILA